MFLPSQLCARRGLCLCACRTCATAVYLPLNNLTLNTGLTLEITTTMKSQVTLKRYQSTALSARQLLQFTISVHQNVGLRVRRQLLKDSSPWSMPFNRHVQDLGNDSCSELELTGDTFDGWALCSTLLCKAAFTAYGDILSSYEY